MKTKLAVIILAVAVVLLVWTPWKHVSLGPERRVDVPVDVVLETDYGPAIALSPDASSIAFAGSQLYLHRINEQKSTPLAFTSIGVAPAAWMMSA